MAAPGSRSTTAAAKGDVVSTSLGLAKQVIRSGFRANCVSPGLTGTEMNPPHRRAKLVPNVAIAGPDQIARANLFPLSKESFCTIGAGVTVSGGR